MNFMIFLCLLAMTVISCQFDDNAATNKSASTPSPTPTSECLQKITYSVVSFFDVERKQEFDSVLEEEKENTFSRRRTEARKAFNLSKKYRAFRCLYVSLNRGPFFLVSVKIRDLSLSYEEGKSPSNIQGTDDDYNEVPNDILMSGDTPETKTGDMEDGGVISFSNIPHGPNVPNGGLNCPEEGEIEASDGSTWQYEVEGEDLWGQLAFWGMEAMQDEDSPPNKEHPLAVCSQETLDML